MRLCIIGLPSSGKTTVFRALTGAEPGPGDGQGAVARIIPVPDERVDNLSAIYHPRKTTYATVEYVDLGGASGMTRESRELGPRFLNAVRQAAALVHVVDAFVFAYDPAPVVEAIEVVDTELVLSDLSQAEKRLERLAKEGNTKSGPRAIELQMLEQARAVLATGKPLRRDPSLAQAEALRGFTFLSAKPILTVVNTAEEHPAFDASVLPPAVREQRSGEAGVFVPLCAKLEAEIASLPAAEARTFLSSYGILTPARERVIRHSYTLLGLMSFFTVGEDEVRAWTLRQGASALEAAAAIHSDLARGFIAAEVCSCDTVMTLGGFEQASRHGKQRLEGKTYPVKDGDVISIRFNV